MIDSLVGAGMDVARLNFSHGAPEEHAARVAAVRRASGHYEKPSLSSPICKDQKSAPALSSAAFPSSCISARNSRSPREKSPAPPKASAPHSERSRSPFTKATEFCERWQYRHARHFYPRRNSNLPGGKRRRTSRAPGDQSSGRKTENSIAHPKDRSDLAFALSIGVNYVALSFVRTAADVRAAKAAIRRAGKDIPDHRQARKARSHRQSR